MSDLLTARQVQDLLKVNRITIYRMLQDGRLKGVKIGQQWRFPSQEVDRLLGMGSIQAQAAELEANLNFPTHCVQTIQELFSEVGQVSAVVIDRQGKPLTEISPEENGYLLIVEKLRQEIEALRRNHLEESYRTGLPVDDFFRPELPPPRVPAFRPIPGWAGVVLLLAIFYLVTSWYLNGCAPRMYYQYSPKALPYQPLPDAYLRDNPVRPPQEVPLRPADDTAGRLMKLPE